MSANPVPIRQRSSASSTSGSTSTSPSRSSVIATPPTFAQSFHPNSINVGHKRSPQISPALTQGNDAPFLGTPFSFALERPYEYPFPSPATESCPNLSTTVNVTATGATLGLVHIPPPTQPSVSSPTQPHASLPVLPSVLPPTALSALPPSSSRREGATARMPLFLRRTSYAPDSQPPVPPALLSKARDMNRRKSIGNGAAMRNMANRPPFVGR